MIKIEAQIEQTLPAKSREVPACPRCGRALAVHRAGWNERKSDTVQAYRCLPKDGGCGAWFLEPSREFVAPGRRANLRRIRSVLEKRRRGLTFSQIGKQLGISAARARVMAAYRGPVPSGTKIGCRFEVVVSPHMILSLRGIFRDAMRRECESDAEMAEFLSERIDTDCASYAMQHTVKPPEHGRNRNPRAGDFYSIVAVEK
jgi:hypothetical protein